MATTKPARKRLKKLVIKESRWLRWGSKQSSLLWGKSPHGKGRPGNMCCLGFLAQACGADARQIASKYSPQDAPKIKWPKGVLESRSHEDSRWTLKALGLNDSRVAVDDKKRHVDDAPDTTLEERKDLLAKHFLKIGFKLVFVP